MRTFPYYMLILLFTLSSAAAPVSKKNIIPSDVPKQFTEKEKFWIDKALSEEYLMAEIKIIASEFQKGRNGKRLSISDCLIHTNTLKIFSKYYFLELDSGISRNWIKSCIKYTDALTKAQQKINFLLSNNQIKSDEYRRWYEYYRKTAAAFVRIAAKPQKVQDQKKLAQLAKIKKAVIEREKAKEDAEKAKLPVLNEKKKRR